MLAYDAFTSYVDPYLSVSDVVHNSATYLHQNIQVLGIVENGSFRYDNTSKIFSIIDENSALEVIYSGSLPDTFQEGGQVVVIGSLITADTVESTQILVKCPSKYEGEGTSLIADPIFLVAIVLGSGAIVGTIATTTLKKKRSP